MDEMKDDWNISFMCTLYEVLGTSSAFCNALNLIIICSNRDLRQRYLYLAALNVCEMVNAVSYILVGVGRSNLYSAGVLNTSTTIHDCFFRKFWPHSLILGTETIAYCMILISCERMLAVLWPVKCRIFFSDDIKAYYLLLIPVLCLISMMVALVSAHMDGDRVVKTQHCFIIDSTAVWYSSFHFVMIVVAFSISFISFFVAWKISRRLPTGENSRKNYTFGHWVLISGSALILVSIPSAVMLFKLWSNRLLNDIVVALTYSLPGLLSLVNTV
ncbi:hypothetical protein Q1695_003712 [Nippostrongylus brasiliensis]|nr:hypothetical protein Q1695_003712 [Nippostrongylus brasiliensis]